MRLIHVSDTPVTTSSGTARNFRKFTNAHGRFADKGHTNGCN